MSDQVDYYETLQISPNADVDTIQRVFRLLAQRFHPDNQDTGNAARFRELAEAYEVLNDAARRAQYDIHYQALKQERWRLASSGPPADSDFDMEQQLRAILLEILYTRRRTEPEKPSLSTYDLSQLTGQPREHLEFTIWYLIQKKFVTRDDQSSLTITVDGVDNLEHRHSAQHRRRLQAASTPVR
jgi:curved DNA-binding protein CbpA